MAILKQLLIYLRSSLWFLPSAIVGGLVALGFVLLVVDENFQQHFARFNRALAASPEGSQGMLSAIATSMITVAGVVFSITIVALAQASAQFSPRVLRNFMRDRGNQIVLGAFVGIFAYCLVVLRNVSHKQDAATVPSLAVFVGFMLALVGIGFLIYFIHHIASSIQASVMVDGITVETLDVIREMFPDTQQNSDNDSLPDYCEKRTADCTWHPVLAHSFGYVQVVETNALFKIACRENLVIRMEVGVGDFAYLNRPLLSVSNCDQPSEKLTKELNRCYGIDSHQTVDQDPGFGVQQLVDMAVKALSPGINDTSTAVAAVDYLSQILSEVAPLRLEPAQYKHGSDIRIISRGITFERLLDRAFDMIIENAEGNYPVITHLLSSLQRIAECTNNRPRLQALLEQCNSIKELADCSIHSSRASQKAKEQAKAVHQMISRKLS